MIIVEFFGLSHKNEGNHIIPQGRLFDEGGIVEI